MTRQSNLVFAVAVLATHRAARAISEDTITKGWRRRVKRWAYRPRAREPRLDWRPWLNDLIECPFCTGFWLSGAAAVWITPRRRWWWRFPLYWWAIAGGQATLASLQAHLDQKKDEVKALNEIADD